MIEQLIYINSMNESLEFGKGKLFINESDLHDFSWSVTSKNDRISGFKKGIVSKTIPIILKCNSDEEGILLRNRIFEVMEKDVLTMKHGKLFIGDYYLKCYAVESKKSEYLKDKGYMKISLKISTDLPYWIKETKTTFGYGEGTSGSNLDYNNDFPYDYASNLLGQQINNNGIIPQNFVMNIYGACENPKVTIGGHDYSVNVSIEKNEYLTIDSIKKTVILTHKDGSTENCYDNRSRDSYIHEPIPVGINKVTSNANFKFDITLFEERSEPKWI